MLYANNKGADQPVYLCSLISTIVVRCLDSIIPRSFWNFKLASVAEQAGLSQPWSQTLKTSFLVTRLKCKDADFLPDLKKKTKYHEEIACLRRQPLSKRKQSTMRKLPSLEGNLYHTTSVVWKRKSTTRKLPSLKGNLYHTTSVVWKRKQHTMRKLPSLEGNLYHTTSVVWKRKQRTMRKLPSLECNLYHTTSVVWKRKLSTMRKLPMLKGNLYHTTSVVWKRKSTTRKLPSLEGSLYHTTSVVWKRKQRHEEIA